METAKLEAREIKKFAKYGLIKTTLRSKTRFSERNIVNDVIRITYSFINLKNLERKLLVKQEPPPF